MFRKVRVCPLLATMLLGCAAQRPPIRTEAALGKVIVYRNGVAYFERRARVTDGELKLTVPVDRVDDFLKSLKVTDSETHESLPVSFKTVEPTTDLTDMVVSVPGKGARDLLVSYVTDSPAWKPSYRVVLGGAPGKAELEAWAVVDNVSGEDWKQVTVGVGSTSALSFRYDLRSVRLVERETLGDDPALGLAPPEGGSPYAVAAAELPLVGQLGGSVVDRIVDEESSTPPTAQAVAANAEGHKNPHSKSSPTGGTGGGLAKLVEGAAGESAAAPVDASATRGGDDLLLDRLADQIKKEPGKVKLEGFARAGDKDQHEAALRRANGIRDRLIARGVAADKVDAAASTAINESQAVRIIATGAAGGPQQAKKSPDEGKEPIGDAYFVASEPMTIEKDRSAMVSLLKSDTKAERVYFYDPISSRGSKEFAFQAIRFENPSEYTLDRGPFTVYADGQFLGEGLCEAVPPKTTAFVPFALDREIVVDPTSADREEILRLVTIDRGIIDAEMQKIRKTTLSLHNRGAKDAEVYVRHAVPEGFDLRPSGLKTERLSGAYLFRVVVPARSATDVSIEETAPIKETIDMRTPAGAESVGLYLKSSTDLPPKLRADLEEVLALYREMADVEQRISTLATQMDEYRGRVDELNAELVTLRRVKTADTLSRSLAKKMQQIADRLQEATLKSVDLQEELLTRRIRVQDRLADISLHPDGSEEKVGSAALLPKPRS